MVNHNNQAVCSNFFICDVKHVLKFNNSFFSVLHKYIGNITSKLVIPCFIDLWDTATHIKGQNML